MDLTGISLYTRFVYHIQEDFVTSHADGLYLCNSS